MRKKTIKKKPISKKKNIPPISNQLISKTSSEIKDIITVFMREGKGLNEMKFENKDFRISLRKQLPTKFVSKEQVADIQQTATLPTLDISKEQSTEKKDEKRVVTNNNQYIIKSPMVGTFYSRPSPDKPPFVSENSQIKHGQILGFIEAMKIFNEIESEVTGKVIKIFVEDASPVEFDQPLFIIEK